MYKLENKEVENRKLENREIATDAFASIASLSVPSGKTDQVEDNLVEAEQAVEESTGQRSIQVPERAINRRLESEDVLRKAEMKTKKALERKVRKKAGRTMVKKVDFEKLPTKAGWSDVRDWLRIAVRKKYGKVSLPSLKPHEKTLARKLLDDHGEELVERAIFYLVDNWEDFSTRMGINSRLPSVAVAYGYSSSLFGEVQLGKGDKSVRFGEYDAKSADESPATGWGDLAGRTGD
jgi:hypothetical protein